MNPPSRLLETTPLTLFATDGCEGDDSMSAPLNVLIAYEDAPSARRALRATHELATWAAAPVELNTKFCRLAQLDDGEWRHEATRDADQADMIIVTTRDATELAVPVSSWLEECLAHRDETKIALLALFGSTDTRGFALHDGANLRSRRQMGSHLAELPCFAQRARLASCA